MNQIVFADAHSSNLLTAKEIYDISIMADEVEIALLLNHALNNALEASAAIAEAKIELIYRASIFC